MEDVVLENINERLKDRNSTKPIVEDTERRTSGKWLPQKFVLQDHSKIITINMAI